MKPLSLFVAFLASLNHVACTRIIKHYHYHFSAISFPVPVDSDGFSVVDEFISRNYASLAADQRYVLKNLRTEILTDRLELSEIITSKRLGYYARVSQVDCSRVIALLQQIVAFTSNDTLLRECESASEDWEVLLRSQTRNGRLSTRVELGSRA